MQLIINEKVAGAEKQATKAEKQMQKAEKTATIGTGKQMQKAEKNSYHGSWETNMESIKLL